MAITEFKRGEHPHGFVGLRVATTLGLTGKFCQAHYSYNDLSRERAWELAEAQHQAWRQLAAAQRRESALHRRSKRAGPGWIAAGFRAALVRESSIRSGRRRMYFVPAFCISRWDTEAETRNKNRSKAFRFNVLLGNSLESAFEKAERYYSETRELTVQQQDLLRSRRPEPDVFVKMAISLGHQEYTIDVNSIRRRVGVPEL